MVVGRESDMFRGLALLGRKKQRCGCDSVVVVVAWLNVFVLSGDGEVGDLRLPGDLVEGGSSHADVGGISVIGGRNNRLVH